MLINQELTPISLAATILCICDSAEITDPVSATRGAIGRLTGATAPGWQLPDAVILISDLITIAFPDFKGAGDTANLVAEVAMLDGLR